MPSEREQNILIEARDRLKRAMEDDYDNRQVALDDLRFFGEEGAQWPAMVRAEREADGRPCLTINKMPAFVDQVVGDQRMNRPTIKVVPVDSAADPHIASILSGWIKHVWEISSADVAVDHGFEHAVICGYGALRVVTEYTDDDSFEQDALIKKVDNALAIFWGPHSEYDCSDAMYCFIISDMEKDEFEEKYGERQQSFDSANSMFIAGGSKDTVRIAEYFVKEPVRKTIYLLGDGRVVDKKPDPSEMWVANKREVDSFKIKRYLLSGSEVLEENEWAGRKYIPVIPIWGKEVNIAGNRVIRGLIRNAKDCQRMYNYWESADTELVALAPKFPYLVTASQIDGHEAQWKEANRKNFPYLIVNHDPQAPGWPQRQPPPQASSAMVEKIQMADQEIRDTMGLQKASLGMQSNERSGIAIRERKQEGDVGTFAFMDNLARSVEHCGRVLVDVAPGILDNARIIRLGMRDGLYEFQKINQSDSDGNIINDMSIGKYDVVVTVGPSFTTQRTEARQSMAEFIQYYPQAATIIGDLYAKSMDWPGAQEVAERLEYLLPPEIKAKIDKKRAELEGKGSEIPAQPQGPPPDPVMMVKLQEEQVKLQELQINLEQEKVKLEQERMKLKGMMLQNEQKAAEAAMAGAPAHVLASHMTPPGQEQPPTEPLPPPPVGQPPSMPLPPTAGEPLTSPLSLSLVSPGGPEGAPMED